MSMRIPPYARTFSLLLVALLAGLLSVAQTTSASEKAARQWVSYRGWQPGYVLPVYDSVNAREFFQQYHAHKAAWDKALAFLADPNTVTLDPGKYPIAGDTVYASITEGPSKTLEQAGWESHRKYIDLQYVLRGKEQISVVPIEKATVVHPYEATRDGASYTATGTDYIAAPGTFYLFFPHDVHRPNVQVNGYDIVKKLVIKIRYFAASTL
ncbi:YhcH/YjgK/YiaL family protein [Chitinophaga costaii]|nr:YhcH/YjgK/YiaL family protein [Chitinophaga costaii]